MEKNKVSLTEATMLALQGKLILEESINVSVDDTTNVSVEENTTIVETEDATVIIQEPLEELPNSEPPMEEIMPEETEVVEVPTELEVPTEEVPSVEEIVDTEPVVDEVVEPEETEEVEDEPIEESKEIEGEVLEEDMLEEGRLNFKSAGIVRAPKYDFSDDGNRFYGYECNGVPISYLKDPVDGDVYLSIRVDYLEGLTSDEYYELPSYKDHNKYNGVPSDEVDLKDVADICARIKAEYDEALSNVAEVSDDDFKKYGDDMKATRAEIYQKAKDAVRGIDLLECSEYEIKKLKEYLQFLKKYVDNNEWDKLSQHSQSYRRKIMQPDRVEYDKKPGFYFEQIMEIVGKYADTKTEALQESKEEDIKAIMAILNEGKTKFSSKTFTEALTKYFKEKYEIVESVKLNKVLKTEGKIKLEASINTIDGINKDICLEMKQVQAGRSFTKYTLQESKGLIKESVNSEKQLTMMTFTGKNNILECKYIIEK